MCAVSLKVMCGPVVVSFVIVLSRFWGRQKGHQQRSAIFCDLARFIEAAVQKMLFVVPNLYKGCLSSPPFSRLSTHADANYLFKYMYQTTQLWRLKLTVTSVIQDLELPMEAYYSVQEQTSDEALWQS